MSVRTMEDLNEAQLAAVVEDYPYYSVAQFRLLSKYKHTGHKNFDSQGSVVSLFFRNQRWLNWQLDHTDKIVESNDDKADPVPGDAAASPSNTVVAETKNEDPIAFEPLHTVDYFASQGIKVSEEALSQDRLGTQLKSFTEWLKSMKKIHLQKASENDDQTDKIIQHLAEGSNTNITVVTEAMAEVLLNQGKVEQAIEIYNKLSLNNPSGSAYFAAKINSLKPA
jgi:hypothetical protein